MDKKIIVIIVLSIALLITSYIAFKPSAPLPDNTLIEKLKDSLKQNELSAQQDIKLQQDLAQFYRKKYDSLNSLPPQIKIVYVKTNKKIDTAYSKPLIMGFDSIFTNNGFNRERH